jgi:Fe-Mn family superoxide dismutase
MAQTKSAIYKAATFSNLRGLQGISDQQIEQHLELYGGYVRNTNLLNEQIADLTEHDKGASPEGAELTRRLGFEYNGMILHEYYFGNLAPSSSGRPTSGSELDRAIAQGFGNFDKWLADFRRVGAMRGVGWAILFQDPANGRLSNLWVTLHQDGHPAGFKPLLVMDVWEHAYMVDYKATERAKGIEAFVANIDWKAVEGRMTAPEARRPTG